MSATFATLELHERCRAGIAAIGWDAPTQVQAQGLPPALAGRDLLVCAPTGTGKTGLFALALLTRLAEGRPRPAHPRGLVIVPTRELAVQVAEVAQRLGGTEVPALFGGVAYGAQDRALERRPDIVVATPGRLLDHIARKAINLADVRILVLDEADRLFDAGFRDEMRAVLGHIPERRQTILLSATLPDEMPRMARALLREPAEVRVGAIAPRERIRESFHSVAEDRKDHLLLALLRENPAAHTLVFARTRRKTARLVQLLRKARLDALELHGGLTQPERLAALDTFRTRQGSLLVATDVAARGLDIPELALVLNYDVPNTPEDYVHRSGRTGRLERAGTVLTLVAPRDLTLVAAIEMFLHRTFNLERREGFAPGDEAPLRTPLGGSQFWRDLERPHDMEERPLHTGKAQSPFTRSGHLRREHRAPLDDEPKPRRGARKRAVRKMKNAKLPHQRKTNRNPPGPNEGQSSAGE